MASITFVVPGKPFGKASPRAVSMGGHARMRPAESNQKYEARVQEAFYAAVAGKDWRPLEGPIILTVVAVHQTPGSMKKADKSKVVNGNMFAIFKRSILSYLREVGVWRTKRPDLSNIVKSVEDGLNELAFVDDKQVVGILAAKIYGKRSEVQVVVEEIGV